jgi:exosortase/archaeosortase family protein
MAEFVPILNARVGKVARRAWLPPQASNDAQANTRTASLRWNDASTAPLGLLVVLLVALWPHGLWMARRLTDGSDEPWGILALATVLVLVLRARHELAVPAPAALLGSAGLGVAAGLARLALPPLAAALLAMAALATFLASALRGRATAPIASLLLLSLPVIASLQFYFGYPMRLVTAALAAPLLRSLGYAVQAAGASLAYDGRFVLVDAPCAGIGMLWVGAYTAALLSYCNGASAARTALNGGIAAISVFAANVSRNVALFFPEALGLQWPAWSHAGIGLLFFGLALLPIVGFVQRPARAAFVPLVRSLYQHARPA